MLKSLHSLGSCAENFPLIQISSILSVMFTRLWLKCHVLMGQLHIGTAFWELWLSDDQPHSDYNGQWQRALCILAVLQTPQPNPQRNEKKRKMYAIKQIKICAEYRDMLHRPRLDLSSTPGLRAIGLSPGSWQTSLGLGSMFRYSAQILICIVKSVLKSILINKDYVPWLLFVWRLCCQPIRGRVWKSLLTNLDLTWKLLSNPGPGVMSDWVSNACSYSPLPCIL